MIPVYSIWIDSTSNNVKFKLSICNKPHTHLHQHNCKPQDNFIHTTHFFTSKHNVLYIEMHVTCTEKKTYHNHNKTYMFFFTYTRIPVYVNVRNENGKGYFYHLNQWI